MRELLFGCPYCKKHGFTEKGLKAHCCRKLLGRSRIDRAEVRNIIQGARRLEAIDTGIGKQREILVKLEPKIRALQSEAQRRAA